ncbi:MAG: hypothetical protein U9N50_06970 [Pseudomonadota bacterium]|nr:hypothetical protein [Pseudomonadota bacterium]
MKTELFYVHDPMCSWCWGFSGVAKQLFNSLPEQITLHRLLGGLAADLGLDQHRFARDLSAARTQNILMEEIQHSRELHADSFPSLVFKAGDSTWPVAIDYLDASPMLELIEMFLDMEESK